MADFTNELPYILQGITNAIPNVTKLNTKNILFFNSAAFKVLNITVSKFLHITFISLENGREVKCTLYIGRYIVKYDGFNDITYKVSKEDLENTLQEYNSYYYRVNTIKKRKLERESKIKVCPICKKEFINSRKKYCSKECEVESRYRKNRIERGLKYSKVCKKCKERFFARNINQKYCKKCSSYKSKNNLVGVFKV